MTTTTHTHRPPLSPRAIWAAGDWDSFSERLTSVGALVLERSAIRPGMKLLDVATGSGGNTAIPAAQQGAAVIGLDITPELLVHARRRASEAVVDVKWVEGDAQDLPFPDRSFDRVISMFGAMFAPDHERAAAELVRVCAPRGRVVMTTWVQDGFAGELFELTASYLPAPPAGTQTPSQWGVPEHIEEMFGRAGLRPSLARETAGFEYPSIDHAVQVYATEFGPFVAARPMLEAEGRWNAFLAAFADLVARFSRTTAGGTHIEAEYFVVTGDPG